MSSEEAHAETSSSAEMVPHELILLSSFTFPTHSTPYLDDQDVHCFLNGYLALWHPALLLRADGLPKIAYPHDYEQPSRGHVYAIPETPYSHLPEDWPDRVKEAGAVAFVAYEDRQATLQSFREAMLAHAEAGASITEEQRKLLEFDLPTIRPFSGIGFGYAHLDAMFETMDHENVVDVPSIAEALRSAAERLLPREQPPAQDEAEEIAPLQAAARLLLEAREVLYQADIYLIDLYLLEPDRFEEGWPLSLEKRSPVNVLATASVLEKLAKEHPDKLETLKARISEELAEVCGGGYAEREEPLLPIESQLWNLVKGTTVSAELLGQDVKVFARKRFYAHPQTPALLQSVGLDRALLLSFGEEVLPYYHSSIINWPSQDGKQVDAFCKPPHSANSAQTYYHLAQHLHETLMHDHSATFTLIHTGPACDWYEDWLELSKLAPILGQWITLSDYVEDVTAGDYASPASADEFHGDYLVERASDPQDPAPEAYHQGVRLRTFTPTEDSRQYPVSSFANHVRLRRAVDAAWTFAGIYRSLAGAEDTSGLDKKIAELEDRLETAGPVPPSRTDLQPAIQAIMQESAETLAARIMRRGVEGQSGYLALNPCSYGRRAILELDDLQEPIPVKGLVKACQMDEDKARLVVEIPAMGFTWIPSTASGAVKSVSKMRMADERCVRNEFFEAEIDHQSGGLRGLRDHRTKMNRMGGMLVYNPGSRPRVKEVKTTSTGPAYGEIVTEGELVNDHEEVLADFRIRYRAWTGRRVLDVRIELEPKVAPEGHPWHAYYCARFAWADERATLIRGVGNLGHVSSQMRPESAEYLELRTGSRSGIVILPGGLPFHQRQGGRMVDVILVPQGERARTFDLALGLDHDYPMLISHGMTTPVAVVKTTHGLPEAQSSSWLYHVDALNLLLTSLRPAPENAHAVCARLVEHVGHATTASLRCVRNPVKAELIDSRGVGQMETSVEDDTVLLDVGESELIQLRIDFA